MPTLRQTVFSKFIILVLLLKSIPVFATTEERMRMNKVVVGVIGNLPSADPLLGRSFLDFLVIQSRCQTLVRMNDKGTLVGDLAKSWTISKDGKSYKFTLDKTAKFHDGSSVNVEDVIFSLSRHLWKNSPTLIGTYLTDKVVGSNNLDHGKIPAGIKKIGGNDIEIELTHPYIPFLQILSMPGFSIIKKGEEASLIGSGPLKATKVTDQNILSFHSYEAYSGIKSLTNELELRYLKNDDEALEGLKNEEFDVVLEVIS